MKIIIKSFSLLLPGSDYPISPSSKEWDNLYSSHTCITRIPENVRNNLLEYTNSVPSFNTNCFNRKTIQTIYNIPNYVLESTDEACHYALACGIETLKQANLNIYDTNNKIKGLETNEQDMGVISVGMFQGYLSLMEGLEKKKGVEKTYLQKLIVKPSSQFSQLVRAKGPSMHIDTACSSTTYAMSIAEDWIKSNRCSRVIIIGADIPCHENLFPLVASGFQRLGVLTLKDNIEEASCPLDKKRSGFILGCSALGILLSKEVLSNHKGVELMATEIGNSAYLTLSLDEEYMTDKLKKIINTVVETLPLTLEQISTQLIYVMHETSTPRCAWAEITALRNTFGIFTSNIILCALKGIAGHSLSTSYEEVIMIDILSRHKLPQTIHFDEMDPKLGKDLNISRGGTHNRNFGLRFSAGFGSSLGYSFYRHH